MAEIKSESAKAFEDWARSLPHISTLSSNSQTSASAVTWHYIGGK